MVDSERTLPSLDSTRIYFHSLVFSSLQNTSTLGLPAILFPFHLSTIAVPPAPSSSTTPFTPCLFPLLTQPASCSLFFLTPAQRTLLPLSSAKIALHERLSTRVLSLSQGSFSRQPLADPANFTLLSQFYISPPVRIDLLRHTLPPIPIHLSITISAHQLFLTTDRS